MKKIVLLLLFLCVNLYSQEQNTLKFQVLDIGDKVLNGAEVYVDGSRYTKSDSEGWVRFNYNNERKAYNFEIRHTVENIKKQFSVLTTNGQNSFSGSTLLFNQIAAFIRLDKQKDDLTTIFDNLDKCGATDLFVETFYDGGVIYPTAVKGIGKHGDKDYLRMILDEAKKHKIRIHSTINALYWLERESKNKNYIPNGATQVNRNGVAEIGEEFSTWFASPAHPEVKRILSEVVKEIATKYPDLYGISFDYLRFKIGLADKNIFDDFGYDTATINKFIQTTKIHPKDIQFDTSSGSNWMKWVEYKENLITNLLVKLSSSARLVKNNICITVNASPYYLAFRGIELASQNWPEFLQFGQVDYLLFSCFPDYIYELQMAYRYHDFGTPVLLITGNPSLAGLERQFNMVKQFEFQEAIGIQNYIDITNEDYQKFLHSLMFK